MLREPLLLPKVAFITAWKWEGHGQPHAVVGADELWLDPETRRSLEDKVLDVLAQLGLASGGMLSRQFRDTIALFAQSTRRFSAWVGNIETGETGGILAAGHDGEAARLLREDKLVRIDPVRVDRLAEALVSALPAVPPARIGAIAVPQANFTVQSGHQQKSVEDLIYDPPSQGVNGDQQLRELMAARRSGAHQLYAAITGHGAERRSKPLTAVDVIGRGRLLTFQSGPMIHCLPGSPATLVESLNTTLAGLGS